MNLMVNGEVVLEVRVAAVAAIKLRVCPRLCLPERRNARLARRSLNLGQGQGKQLDQAYEYINWSDGWPAAFVAGQGTITPSRKTRKGIWSRGVGLPVRR